MSSRDGTAEAESSSMALSRVVALPPAPRVCQVDADELDEGLVSMLGERVDRAIINFRASPPLSDPGQMLMDRRDLKDWT